MSDSKTEHDEALLPGLEYSLGAFDLPADVAALRALLLQETSRVVQGHRRRKRSLRLAGWGLAYAAGLLSAWLGLRQFTEQPTQQKIALVQQESSAKNKETNSQAKKAAIPTPKRRMTPEELRARVAGAKRDEQIDLLRRAGDLYLNERNDLRSAVTCYQQVLELAETPEHLAVLPDDSWLLAELKNAQRTQ